MQAAHRMRLGGRFGRNIMLLFIVAACVSAIFTYVSITGNSKPLDDMQSSRISTLMLVNITLLLVLVTLVISKIFSLRAALKKGMAGSKLQKRILILFSLVTILPTIAVSIFSAMFFNLGIQTWFNDKVQTAVNESYAVAQAYLAEHQENIRGDIMAMANDLNQSAQLAITNPAEFNHIVATQATVRELTEALVIQHNKIIAQGRFSFALAFESIPQNQIEQAENGKVVLMSNETSDKVRALVKLEAMPDAFLIVGRLVDSKVLAHMENSKGAVSAYNQLKGQLDHLQMVFSVMFITLALLLLLSSVGYGMVFASRLSRPISALVIAAEQVRSGDYSARATISTQKDELTTLGRTFNRMTEQLQTQRTELIEANRRLDERRRFTEAVLSGVSAGVIALGKDKQITLFNPSSVSILSAVDIAIDKQKKLNQILPGTSELLLRAEQMPGEVVQDTITLDNEGKSITLHVRVSTEELDDAIEGYIVTFDDITVLVSAQRTAAWADVARRVAHEIRNPLTPIQLSTERLKKKYLKYITEDQDNYLRYIDTIAKHAGDIGKMVEEFVSFARMPMPIFAQHDIGSLIKKAVFSAEVACPDISFITHMPTQPQQLVCDERQMTQVFTNLLKNSAESIESRLAGKPDSQPGRISVTVERTDETLRILVEDNGTGFPEGALQRMFEPYVTTRTK
ncbi:MAG: HAMP domain-containing protein, partial [Alphaproteobacteria bacterium]